MRGSIREAQTVAEAPHDALDSAMEAARVDLELTWNEVAQRIPMSASNLRLIRRGRIGIPALTARKIENALGWERGRVRQLRPKDVIVDKQTSDRELPAALRSPLTQRELRDDTERAIWSVEDASEDARWAAVFRYRVGKAKEYGVQLEPGDEKWG